ncbi:MAG: hypothetical protein HN742_32810 [Lentisphaerae bacterium]|nr:hypothetical protein [Lentisphaerota bacterium]MBT4822608.1 hypothetical protein [Lentisphaerota bacterium]MBT5610910.1 hypothetical protein [Lentisphaerota bacterium]MBT7055907.1 hypothetical protein [Lentisphaerota bacterium]MBT7846698.1 hypothetical protein [Lentisphaerota bacterium]
MDFQAETEWIREAIRGLRAFVRRQREPGQPWGVFRLTETAEWHYGQQQTSVCGSMTARVIGLLNELSEEDKDEWATCLNGQQQMDTGFYVDGPHFARYCANHSDLNEQLRVREGWTRNSLQALRQLERRPAYPIRHRRSFASAGELLTHIESLTWAAGPWGAGSWFGLDGLYLALAAKDGDAEAARLFQVCYGWMRENQSPETGFWRGEQATLVNAVNGAFKIMAAYVYGLHCPLQYPEALINTCLRHLGDDSIFGENAGHGCHDLDVFLCLDAALQLTDHRREEAREAAARRIARLRYYLRSDGGLDASPVAPGSEAFRELGTLWGSALITAALDFACRVAEPEIFEESGLERREWSDAWSDDDLERVLSA